MQAIYLQPVFFASHGFFMNSYGEKTIKGRPHVTMRTEIWFRSIPPKSAGAQYKKEINMNNLYHWHNEQMVKHEMQEVNRAVEQARLLKDAGLADGNLLARALNAFRKLMIRRGNEPQDDRSAGRQSNQSHTDKAVL